MSLAAADTHVRVRPLEADDRERLAALFARLSPQSRYRRYLSPKQRLTSDELARLTDVDHVRHEALAAIDPRDGAIVGVARYVARDECAAEVAVEVADELQRRGIGATLAQLLVARARVNGFARLTATTLWENRPARALLRRVGFRARRAAGSEVELELELKRIHML